MRTDNVKNIRTVLLICWTIEIHLRYLKSRYCFTLKETTGNTHAFFASLNGR